MFRSLCSGDPAGFLCHFLIFNYYDFRYDGIHIQSSVNQNEILFVPYSAIKWIDLFVVRRRWGTGILTMMIPWFDFDLIIHLEHDEIEIEFPAFFEEIPEPHSPSIVRQNLGGVRRPGRTIFVPDSRCIVLRCFRSLQKRFL